MAEPPYTLEFFESDGGSSPVLEWLRALSPAKRRAIGAALEVVLRALGPGIAGTKYGKQLGQGLLEFRVAQPAEDVLSAAGHTARSRPEDRGERILLRVFVHCHGQRLVLLLGGYDKGGDPKKRRQEAEIEIARGRLAEWRRR